MSLPQHWSTIPGDNQTADPSINWRENQAPSTYNDSARQMMAQLKRMYLDMDGTLTTGGTSTAYTLATNQVFTALVDGMVLTFRPHVTNGAGPVTLAVDGLTAKPLRCDTGQNMPAGTLNLGRPVRVVYNLAEDEFQTVDRGILDAPGGTRMYFNQNAAPLGWTKETNPVYDLSAIRVLSSSPFGDTGGSLGFNLAFASRAILQGNLPSVNFTGSAASAGLHSHSGATGVESQTHTHTIAANVATAAGDLSATLFMNRANQTGAVEDYALRGQNVTPPTLGVTSTQNGQHTHPIAADGAHTHTVTVNSGGSNVPLDFNVKFNSAIIATKA